MERFPPELLYVLIFLGIILFNLIQGLRRRQQQAQAEAEAPEPAAQEDEPPLEDIWGRSPAPLPQARSAPPAPASAEPARPAAPRAPRRRHPLQTLLKDRRNLHHAIVLMTVLGPCRAQEPPERR